MNYIHILLPIVTKHELGLTFPPRNLPVKFCTNPSTIILVIVVTDRQTDTHTDTQTNAGKTYSLAFAGRIIELTRNESTSRAVARWRQVHVANSWMQLPQTAIRDGFKTQLVVQTRLLFQDL